MSKLVVTEHVTLDGVMQSPSSPGEDPRGGFDRGGWHPPYIDQDFMRIVGQAIPDTQAYLFGRRTYEIMANHWPNVPEGDVFADTLNGMAKHVASTTLEEPLGWKNTTLLKGRVPEAVASLKREAVGTIAVLGSGALVRTLMEHDLIDEYHLMIDPIVLGSGARLFPERGRRIPMRLVSAQSTGAGVIFATYRPEGR